MLYFAYGSNLDPLQMARRCPSARVVCLATLTGHRLTFPRPCASWDGGVAGIEPCDGAHCVECVVYDLCDDDVAALDRYEGVAEGDYTRRQVTVTTSDGRRLEVLTYFANPHEQGPCAPSSRYLGALIRGARHHGLPSTYIAALENIPASDIR